MEKDRREDKEEETELILETFRYRFEYKYFTKTQTALAIKVMSIFRRFLGSASKAWGIKILKEEIKLKGVDSILYQCLCGTTCKSSIWVMAILWKLKLYRQKGLSS